MIPAAFTALTSFASVDACDRRETSRINVISSDPSNYRWWRKRRWYSDIRPRYVNLLCIATCDAYCMYPGGGLLTPDNPIKTPSDLFSFSHIRNATRMEDERLGALRSVSSRPEGVRATVEEQVDWWQNTSSQQAERDTKSSLNDPELQAGIGPHPRIGIGLPMSNIFATCVIL